MSERLFFALWPDDSLREIIAPLGKLHRQCGGRPHPPGNLHITLSFLGRVDDVSQECVELGAGEIAVPTFELTLDRFGYWPKPRVMWLGCTETPEPLLQLAGALNQVMIQCGLKPEERPYHPHLTLLRKAQRSPTVTAPVVQWTVDSFVLCESVSTPTGVEYRVLRRWPLVLTVV